jgi:hypothetical protein
LVLVPVVVGLTQSRSAEHATSEQYVALAISILNEQSKGPPDVDLRKWAVDVIQQKGPVPLPANVANKLAAGAITLTSASGTLYVPR